MVTQKQPVYAVQDILSSTQHTVNLMHNHLLPNHLVTKAKKMGVLLGSNAANDLGITLKTEKLLQSGKKTQPSLQLNKKEQEYIYSQLIQQNYDKRQGNSVFKSKTVRSTFTDTSKKMTSPPPGLYEPKFIKGHEDNNCNADKIKIEESKIEDPLTPRLINPNSKQVDLRYIHKSYTREPTT